MNISKFKDRLVEKFNKVKDAFSGDISKNLVANGGKMPVNHFLFLEQTKRIDFTKLDDLQLAMICGAFDFAITAGEFGYSVEQNLALNDLEDLVFEMKHFCADGEMKTQCS